MNIIKHIIYIEAVVMVVACQSIATINCPPGKSLQWDGSDKPSRSAPGTIAIEDVKGGSGYISGNYHYRDVKAKHSKNWAVIYRQTKEGPSTLSGKATASATLETGSSFSFTAGGVTITLKGTTTCKNGYSTNVGPYQINDDEIVEAVVRQMQYSVEVYGERADNLIPMPWNWKKFSEVKRGWIDADIDEIHRTKKCVTIPAVG